MTTDQTRSVPIASLVFLFDVEGVTWLSDGRWGARTDLVPFAHALASGMHTPGAYRLTEHGPQHLDSDTTTGGELVARLLAQPRVPQHGQLDIAGTIPPDPRYQNAADMPDVARYVLHGVDGSITDGPWPVLEGLRTGINTPVRLTITPSPDSPIMCTVAVDNEDRPLWFITGTGRSISAPTAVERGAAYVLAFSLLTEDWRSMQPDGALRDYVWLRTLASILAGMAGVLVAASLGVDDGEAFTLEIDEGQSPIRAQAGRVISSVSHSADVHQAELNAVPDEALEHVIDEILEITRVVFDHLPRVTDPARGEAFQRLVLNALIERQLRAETIDLPGLIDACVGLSGTRRS